MALGKGSGIHPQPKKAGTSTGTGLFSLRRTYLKGKQFPALETDGDLQGIAAQSTILHIILPGDRRVQEE
jgi:hypothetical protein